MVEHNLGVRETVALLVIMTCTKMFLGLPRMLVEFAATAAWLVVLISMIHLPLTWWALRGLLRLHPGKSLITATEAALGPVVGTLVNVVYVVYFCARLVAVVREFAEVVVIIFLPTTPVMFVVLLQLATGVYVVYLGIEAATRTAWLLAPLMLIGYVLLLLGALKSHTEPQALAPFWGTGASKVINWGLTQNLVGDLLFFGVVAPSFRSPQQLARAFWWTSLFCALIFVGSEIVYLYVFPYPTSAEVLAPLMAVTRTITLGPGIQRVEAAFYLIWLVGGLLKVTGHLYAAASTLAQTLRLQRYRLILPALSLLIMSATLVPRNVTESIIMEAALRQYGGIVTILLPAITWGIGWLRRKRGITRATT